LQNQHAHHCLLVWVKAIPSALGVSATRQYHVNSLAVPRKAKEAIGGITKLTHADGISLFNAHLFSLLGVHNCQLASWLLLPGSYLPGALTETFVHSAVHLLQ
jgi:hypothetical protein